MRRTVLLALLLSAGLSACILTPPRAPDPVISGPRATIADSGRGESRAKGQLFVLAAIDGQPIDDSLAATRRATLDPEMLTMVISERDIPARPMKATLLASHITSAPVFTTTSQLNGTFQTLRGTVDFSPKQHGHYVVKGELRRGGSSIWIEDADTGQIVSEIIKE